MIKKYSPMGSEADIQAWIELEKTDTGNVGADIVVNPVLYRELVKKILLAPHPVILADFGGGTASLALDIVAKDPSSKAALSAIENDLLQARKHIRTMFNVDMYDALLVRGEEQKKQYGSDADSLRMVKVNIGEDTLPFSDEQLDIAISRQFLMHLTLAELRHHLQEVHRVLKKNGWYLATILNPVRDFARYKKKYPQAPELQPEQQYAYEMEHAGLRFSQASTYRPLEIYLTAIEGQGFSVEPTYLSASIIGYEQSHPSYYDKELPMAVLLSMKKK